MYKTLLKIFYYKNLENPLGFVYYELFRRLFFVMFCLDSVLLTLAESLSVL